MHFALLALGLVATVLAGAAVARRTGLSAPLLLTAVGAVASYIPWIPNITVEPELILIGLLPPLLYAAASNTSLMDLKRDRWAIASLSVGLVVASALAVSGVGWLLGLPFATALALGGIVAPPDAVAATAVARRIGLPRRVVSILEGESLFNDATALVIVNTAIGFASASVWSASVGFVRAALGGVVAGVVVFFAVVLVRRHLSDTNTSVALSFMTPWVAYLVADNEWVHASGVIAVVVAGVLLANKAPIVQTAQSRVAERLNWASVSFVLENLVFLLIGLQTYEIVHGIAESRHGTGHAVLTAALVLVTVLLVRPIWILAFAAYRRWRGSAGSLSARESVVASWAGMRGVVTLAAAFLLPLDTPEREVLIFTALIVTVGTLALQGFSLGQLATRLGLHGPDPREDALQNAQLTQAAINAGSHKLDEELAGRDDVPDGIVVALRSQGERRANLAWERLGAQSASTAVMPNAEYRQLRLSMLAAERAKVLKLRDRGVMDHEVLDSVMRSLDVEESMLMLAEDRDEQVAERMLLTPEHRRGGCEHLQADPPPVEPSNHDECLECVAEGLVPVHLRMCLTCGHVACCDSSDGKHATRHFEQTGHPVIRSFEPGEAWRWCYVDNLLG